MVRLEEIGFVGVVCEIGYLRFEYNISEIVKSLFCWKREFFLGLLVFVKKYVWYLLNFAVGILFCSLEDIFLLKDNYINLFNFFLNEKRR